MKRGRRIDSKSEKADESREQKDLDGEENWVQKGSRMEVHWSMQQRKMIVLTRKGRSKVPSNWTPTIKYRKL